MKSVLITGGTRGIGRKCAELFKQNGYNTFVVYNRSTRLAAELESTGIRTFMCDISDELQVCRLYEEIKKLTGGVDILINNAGISEFSLFQDITPEMWDRIFAVNTRGTYLITRAFLPDMISKKSGKIINISSIWGETGASTEVHYSASKAAVIGMTKALAKELGPSGICVNCITPGAIETEMNSHLSPEDIQMLCDEIPLMRLGKPEEVAKAALFLSEADYITGHILAVNGGMNI